MSWIFDIEIQLDAYCRGNTIKEGSTSTNQETKVLIFIPCHFHEGLKIESPVGKKNLLMTYEL